MIKQEEIIEFATKNNLAHFEVDGESFLKANMISLEIDGESFWENKIILLKSNDLSEFIKFVKINESKAIMYCYLYYDSCEYQMDKEDEDRPSFSIELDKIIKKEYLKYNKRISKLDFSKPRELYIFCTINGYTYAIQFMDSWMEELHILTWKEKYNELLNSEPISEIRTKIENKRKEEEQETKDRLKREILSDPHFFACTNKELRRQYAIKLREKAEWDRPNHYTTIKEVADFIESIWSEFKFSKNLKN